MNVNLRLNYPSKDKSPVRIVVSHNGEKYAKSTGFTIETKTWNQSKQKCSVVEINSILQRMKYFLIDSLSELSTEDEINDALSRIDKGTISDKPIIKGTPSMIGYMKEWAERDSVCKRQRKLIAKTIIRLMGYSFNWEDVDSAFYITLVNKMEKEGYSKNYQGTIISKLKVIMNEGLKLKYHSNTEFTQFKKTTNEVDSIYLTEEELDKVWNVKLWSTTENKCRDLFILGCYSGARWEDYSQLSNDNIFEDKLRYIQRKTGTRVILPLSPRIKDVLERNEGKAPKLNSVAFNRTIKVVCERAGINQMVEIRKSKGSGYEQRIVPKHQLVSSHCCRRTLCTLLAKKGVPFNQIMQLSGHKSLSSFQKYLRQSMSETADLLKDLDYFK